MSNKMLDGDNKRRWRKFLLVLTLILFIQTQGSIVKGMPKTIRRTNLILDLGEGVTTEAQLTYPILGDGPFPTVLLVPGGGLTDMDEYIPGAATINGESAAPMKQLSEYLSSRGFLVLRYNKRGVTRNATMENYELYSKATVKTFKADAEKALDELLANPMASESVTLIGHSESSIIVTRMAEDNPIIDNVVMLGASARDYLDIKYTKIVELRVEFAEEVLDLNNDGLVTLQEAVNGMEPYQNAIIPRSSMLMGSGNESSWIPTWDPNGDGVMNLTSEFLPVLEGINAILTNPNYPGYNQTVAHFSLGATMDMIGNINASILILQGEGDYLSPTVEAFLLEQALCDSEHPDHTLLVYPGLSHFFCQTDGWQAAMGPFETYVLEDLYHWLVSPDREVDTYVSEVSALGDSIIELETLVNTNLNYLTESVSTIETTLIEHVNEGGNDYLIPIFTIILVLFIVTLSKKRIL
jgi:pimeloyl-ACP methyl ester carboxylesterase